MFDELGEWVSSINKVSIQNHLGKGVNTKEFSRLYKHSSEEEVYFCKFMQDLALEKKEEMYFDDFIRTLDLDKQL